MAILNYLTPVSRRIKPDSSLLVSELIRIPTMVTIPISILEIVFSEVEKSTWPLLLRMLQSLPQSQLLEMMMLAMDLELKVVKVTRKRKYLAPCLVKYFGYCAARDARGAITDIWTVIYSV